MTPVWINHDQPGYNGLVEFMSRKIWGEPREMPNGMCLGVLDKDELSAVIHFGNYDSKAGVIEISGASVNSRWLTRSILWQMYNYAFNVAGCQAVVQRNDPENTRLARMLTAYGFHRYDIPRLRGRNKGEAIFVLYDDEWRKNGFHKEHD